MQTEVLDVFKSAQEINAKSNKDRIAEGAAIINMAFRNVAVAA